MEQKDGINKLTDDKKNLSKLQYFEIKVKQPFNDEKKSLNNYILKSKSCFYDKTDS